MRTAGVAEEERSGATGEGSRAGRREGARTARQRLPLRSDPGLQLPTPHPTSGRGQGRPAGPGPSNSPAVRLGSGPR